MAVRVQPIIHRFTHMSYLELCCTSLHANTAPLSLHPIRPLHPPSPPYPMHPPHRNPIRCPHTQARRRAAEAESLLARAESLQSRDTIAHLNAQLASALQQQQQQQQQQLVGDSSATSQQQQQQQQSQGDEATVTAAEVAALAAQVAEQSAMVSVCVFICSISVPRL